MGNITTSKEIRSKSLEMAIKMMVKLKLTKVVDDQETKKEVEVTAVEGLSAAYEQALALRRQRMQTEIDDGAIIAFSVGRERFARMLVADGR